MTLSQTTKNQIKLLESITGRKVKLVENTEGLKNLANETLKRVADSLDLIKQDISLAKDKVGQLNDMEVEMTKLRGIDSIIDSVITDVAEMINNVTEYDAEDVTLDDEIGLEEADTAGIEMPIDKAIDNIDDVKKIAEKGVNVIIDDEV